MAVGFKNENGDFVPTEKYLSVLHSSMLFPERKNSMNPEKRNHLYSFMRGAGKSYGVTSGIAKMGAEKIRESRNESDRKRNERINGINESVSVISDNQEMTNNGKISQLQRLLNISHKDMDNALLSRIRLELASLHKANEKIKNKRESKPKQNSEVTFADRIESDEPISEIENDYESDSNSESGERPLSAQELAILSSIQSQVR